MLQFAGCASDQKLQDMAVAEPLSPLLQESGFSAVPACRLQQQHKDNGVQSTLSSRILLARLAELNQLRRGFELLQVLHLFGEQGRCYATSVVCCICTAARVVEGPKVFTRATI